LFTLILEDGLMTPLRDRAVAVLLPLLLGLVAPAAWAGPPTDHLRTHLDAAIRILEDPDLRADERTAERRAAIRGIAEQLFDFAETTKRALGRHWHARTPGERAEIVRVFSDLLERAYVARIELYGGEQVVFAGEALDEDLATVRTRIVGRGGLEIPVDYRLLQREGHWRVYDVVVEGVSLVANYRTQFNRLLQNGSYPELVRRLQARLDEGSAPAVKRTSGR
jgi:phospholipid transport system substrate-binding protein